MPCIVVLCNVMVIYLIINQINLIKMKKGMIFDLYQDGKSTVRVMSINEKDVIDLKSFEIIKDIDFEFEVESILIDDIFEYGD